MSHSRVTDYKRLEEEYASLMELLFNVVDSRRGVRISDDTRWLYETEILAAKLFNHLGTIRYLWHGTSLPVINSQPRNYVDHSSLSVLVRAAFETYLSFYYIYCDTVASNDEKQLRYRLWKLQALLDRQKFTCVTSRSSTVREQDVSIIAMLLAEIEGNSAFSSLPLKQQKLARKGEWRLGKSWADLAEIAGLDKKIFRDIYSYLCSYAHSGGLSALQIGQAVKSKDQMNLAGPSLHYGLMLMGHFIKSYTTIFPDTQSQLENNPELAKLSEKWQISWKEDEFLKGYNS
jgi:hypothetical protein